MVALTVSILAILAENNSLRKHPFLLALRGWRETSPTTKSEEKRMFSQATKITARRRGLFGGNVFKNLGRYIITLISFRYQISHTEMAIA